MKESKCRDAGSDCAAVVRGETTGEVMAQAAPHTEQVHGVDVSTEVADEIQA